MGALTGSKRGEFDAGGAPTAMAKDSAEDLTVGGDFADDAEAGGVGGIESGGGEGDGSAFDTIDDWGEFEVAFEGVAGVVLDVAYGGSDLLVGEGSDVFGEEVDEAGFALEESEDLDGAVSGSSGSGRWSGSSGFGGGTGGGRSDEAAGEVEGYGDVFGELAVEEEGEEAFEGEGKSGQGGCTSNPSG